MSQNLRTYLEATEAAGDLLRVSEELSPVYEVAAVLRVAHEQGLGPAVLCEKVKGYDAPVVGNLFARRSCLARAMGVADEDLVEEYRRRRRQPIAPRSVTGGPVQEVVIRQDVDILREVPVLTYNHRDAGPYFSSAVTMARNPKTGERGMGIHRVQVQGPNRIALFLASPPLSRFVADAESQGEGLEIAVVVGMDPVLWFGSVIWVPEGEDKFAIAGGLAGEAVALTRGVTVGVEVPAEAEYVLEARLIPGQRVTEGPFGESTGYYMTFQSPVAEVLAITRRSKPIYQALVPFGPEEPVLTGVSWESDNLRALQTQFPSVKRVHMAMMTAVVQVAKTSDEEPKAIIEHLFNALHWTKQVVVVDEDVDIYNLEQVDWAIATRSQPDCDFIIRSGLHGSILDPSASEVPVVGRQNVTTRVSSKVGIDATYPVGKKGHYERVDVPPEARARARKVLSGLAKR